VQVAIGDGRAVDLRLEHHALHVVIAFPEWVTEEGTAEGSRIKLSIRRVPPTWAATASRADACRRVTGSIVSGSTSARYSGSTAKGVIASRAAFSRASAERSPLQACSAAALSAPYRESA